MAAALKDFFDRACVERIAGMLAGADPGFPRARFVAEASRGLGELELMDRARHVAAAMRRALPADFERAVDVLVRSLGPELPDEPRTAGVAGMAPFLYLPHTILVAEHGLGHLEASLLAQHALTRRFTAEFSIRPFLERHPEATLAVLARWARDPSPHVRRLVSEGTRPRLPWGPRLRAFQRDPGPALALLELLRDDPHPYVRRSVANHLNDVGKDHPALLLGVCARWAKDASAGREWIVRHALRSLVKAGDPRALAILGFGGGAGLRVGGRLRPARVRIGGKVAVELTVENRSRRSCRAVVDLAVHFVKARGAGRAKVFKGRDLELAPGERASVRRTISFAVHSTRRPFPGEHRVEALVNGRAVAIGSVRVVG